MELPQDKKILLYGTQKGFIIAYSFENNHFQVLDKFFYHNDEITSI